jgi:hypothetical protein
VIAPTETIGLMMDCDTTGIEPDLALVKTKKLVGGGTMQIVNQTVPRALQRLGYTDEQARDILDYIAEHNSVTAAPRLKEEHYPVFDTAMGERTIHYMGLVRMMAAAQPFISGVVEEGEHSLFFKALLDAQLRQLELQPWPLTAADYEHLLDRPFSLEQLSLFWDQSLKAARSEPNGRQVYAFVDFLLQRSTAETATSLQRSLIATDSYWNWITQFIDTPAVGSVTASSVEQMWVDFAYQQSLSGQGQAPIPLPQREIRLWCDANPGRGETIHDYDLASKSWSTDPRLVENDYSLIEALPDGKGLLVESFLFVDAEPRWRALLLQNGQQFRLAEWRSSDVPLESTGRVDPLGQKLVTVEGRQTKAYRLLDLNQCQPADCSLQPLSGIPVWSPQSSQSIVMVDEASLVGGAATGRSLLFRGDDRGQIVTEIGTGYAPFWLDEERYGYVRFNGEMNEVVTAVAGEDEPQVVLTLEGLLSQLPEVAELGQAIISVAVNPRDSGLWLVTVSRASSQQVLVLIEQGRDEAAVTQVSLPQSDIVLPGARFSPDGRWLTVNALDSDTSLRTLHLYDLEGQLRRSLSTDNPYAFVSHDWSADGQWLLFVGNGHLKLVAVDHGYQQLILYPFPRCSDAALVDPSQ